MKSLSIGAAAALGWAVQGATLGPFTGNFAVITTDPTLTTTVPQFNPKAGTLTAVYVTFNSTLSGSLGGENVSFSQTTSQPKVSSSVANTFIFVGRTATMTVTTPKVAGPNLGIFDGILNYRGTSGFLLSFTPTSSSVTQSYTDSATPVAFTGSGGVSFSASNRTTYFSSYIGGQLVLSTDQMQKAKSVTVSYT